MKDEIKEILSLLNSSSWSNEARQIEDYITNLQEEKDDAVQCLKYYEEGHFLKPAIDNTKLTMELANAYMEDINNLQEENRQTKLLKERYQLEKEDYKSRNEKANTLLDELLERAYIDGEYIMYDYSTSELLEVKQALQGEDYNKVERAYLDDEWIGEDKE